MLLTAVADPPAQSRKPVQKAARSPDIVLSLQKVYQRTSPAILDTLVTYLAGLKGDAEGGGPGDHKPAASPALVMPNFNLNDEELRDMVTFLLGLQELTVTYPQHSFAKADEAGAKSAGGVAYAGKSGEEIAKLAGCMTGARLAKDRASRAITEVMIPEAMDYPV